MSAGKTRSDPRLDAAMVEAATSHGRYRQLFEQSPMGLFTYDTRLVITDLNTRFEKILQSKRDRLLGLDMHRLQDQSVLPAMKLALQGETGTYLGAYRATTSSARLWISLRAVALREPVSGEVIGGLGIVEDVTERHEMEQVQAALYEISEAVHSSADLDALYRRIHEVIERRTPAENFYIALWDADSELIRFAYFVDARDPAPGPQKAGSGLTEHVLQSGEPLLMTRDEIQKRLERGDFEARGALPAFWLGVPLRTQESTVGVLALQSYDESVSIDSMDRRILGFIADQIALAIERKRSEAQIERMAYFDSLTDLYNRRMLHEQAEHLFAQAHRHDRSVALLYLDLDRFKHVNDTLGHDAGDDLLVQIAQELDQMVRKGDVLARLGGDEFAVLLPDSGRAQAEVSARRLIERLDRPFTIRDRQVHVGASVGISLFPHHGRDLDSLLKNADIAMYQAKERGGGFYVYKAEASPYSLGRLDLESRLRYAVEHDELAVYYQPIVEVASGRLHSVEALVRWHDEAGRLLPADQFVPLAEESRLVVLLDRFVFSRALADLSELAPATRPRVAVNVSARSLHDPELMAVVRRGLETTGVAAKELVLEITESTAIRDLALSSRVLGELRDLGVSVALDDFGAGYASITYLRRLPCDRLKIARELTAEIGRSDQGERLLEVAMGLGLALNLSIVAEGVETEQQIRWLRERECELAQGYLLGRPGPNLPALYETPK